MKLSIVVPVYNAEAYLPRCIDACLRSRFPIMSFCSWMTAARTAPMRF